MFAAVALRAVISEGDLAASEHSGIGCQIRLPTPRCLAVACRLLRVLQRVGVVCAEEGNRVRHAPLSLHPRTVGVPAHLADQVKLLRRKVARPALSEIKWVESHRVN